MKMFIRDRSKNQISLTTLCGCQGAPRVISGALGAGRCPYTWGRCADGARIRCLPRKEVIQPHLPVRLPCYDFTPLTPRTFGDSPQWMVGPSTSGADDSGGVTGGVYKTRERIHRGMLIRDY